MPSPEETLESLLAPDESVLASTAGRLVDGVDGGESVIAVTDRRLLCLSDDGAFVDVDCGSIRSIRSWSRSRLSYRGIDSDLVVLFGAFAAVASFLAAGVVAAQAAGLAGLLLVFVCIGGTLRVAQVRRRPGTRTLDPDPAVDATVAGGLAVVAFVVIVAAVPGLVTLALVSATLGSLALADHAARNQNEFDGVELIRQSEKELTIHTDDGSPIRLRVDEPTEIDRLLSRHAVDEPAEPVAERPSAISE